MTETVTLTMLNGEMAGQEWTFTKPGTYILGRARDCDLLVPTNIFYLNVSRHQCVFEIDPPSVRVRDLESRNGTFVNGVKIGQRAEVEPLGKPRESTAVELYEGDEVQVGDIVLMVHTSARRSARRKVPVGSR